MTRRWRAPPALGTSRRLRHSLLQLCESLLQIRGLDRAQLQIQKRCQARSDPRMNLTGIDVRDQLSHRVPHGERIVQGRQRIRVFACDMTIAPTVREPTQRSVARTAPPAPASLLN